MISVARIALEPGMELAEDVISLKQGVILPANTVLDKMAIEKLNRYGIMLVSIKEPEDYASTHYEKIALSKNFQNFKTVYQNNLNAYKYMVHDFLENGTPLNQEYLLSLYDQAWIAAKKDGDLLLDMLYSLVPTEDNLNYAHCFNSALIAGVFATWLSCSDELKRILVLSGFFYDIGKLTLPDKIIWKPDKLTDFEYNCMKTHTTIGYDRLKNQRVDSRILDAVLSHHERCDGSGYPNKLRGDAIPYTAKLIGIVDSYEAMTSARTYRASLNPFQVFANFERGGLYQYDLDALTKIMEHIAISNRERTVRLSDDTLAKVRIINPDKLSRPILELPDQSLLDLRTAPDLEIVAIL